MASSAVFRHICETWQPENYEPPSTPSSPCNEFLIEIYVNFMYVSPWRVDQAPGDELVQETDLTLSPTMYKSFRQKCEHLTKDPTSWSAISNMLSQMNIPYHVQPLMIGKISGAARAIASASKNLNLRTLPMVVSIRVVVPVGEESELSAEEESDRSCIERLEKVKVEKDHVGNDKIMDSYRCVICLEEISAGSEAISMPCLHIYHEDCIANWLQRSSLCPLCRCQIPPS